MGIPSKLIFKIIPFAALAIALISILYIVKSQDKSAILYETHCQSCHLENGEGLRGVIPPLAKADYLEKYPEKIACILQNGMNKPVVVNGIEYHENMPANPNLSASEIANIINYVMKNFGNNLPPITLGEVMEQLENCPEDIEIK